MLEMDIPYLLSTCRSHWPSDPLVSGGLIQLWLKSALALAQLAAEQMIPVTSVIKQTIDKNLKDHGVDCREEESEGWLAIRLNTDYEDNNTGSRRNRDS
jgi:hypothetical protein